MSLVFATMLFFLVFDVLILIDDVMAGPILGLKFLDPCLGQFYFAFTGPNKQFGTHEKLSWVQGRLNWMVG